MTIWSTLTLFIMGTDKFVGFRIHLRRFSSRGHLVKIYTVLQMHLCRGLLDGGGAHLVKIYTVLEAILITDFWVQL